MNCNRPMQTSEFPHIGKGYDDMLEMFAEIRCPDMTPKAFLKMLYASWHRCYELEEAIRACRDINDSGEQYHHENADGAHALANLFSMVDGPKETS